MRFNKKLFFRNFCDEKSLNFQEATMEIVKGKKSGYECPQAQIELIVNDVLLTSGSIDPDFDVDTEDWD